MEAVREARLSQARLDSGSNPIPTSESATAKTSVLFPDFICPDDTRTAAVTCGQ
jgi:hypothetical protein